MASVKVARDIAFELFGEGKRPSDEAVKALGLKSKTTYNYYQEWKKQQGTTPEIEKGSTPQSQKVLGKAIEVGKITITPENWGMTQYGAILILDTYNKTKKDIGYSGTVGEFLCDITEFYRRVLNYKEVEYGGGNGEGGGSTEENGEEGVGEVKQLAE